MEAKVCKQCGELKPIDAFRKYYGGRKGCYTVCKMCERINSRAKYLVAKGQKCTDSEVEELNKIQTLWDAQRKAGLQPPRSNCGRSIPLADKLDDMIDKYASKTHEEAEDKPVTDVVVPEELQRWLTVELTEEPDYYIDEVHDKLKDKFRPKIDIDQSTMLPVYDDTYAQVLDQILERFYAYEDAYYDKE